MAKLTGQQLLSALGKTGALVSPSATVTKSVIRSGKEASKEIFGYDFVGLIVKLAVFYGVALLFSKFMEGVIYARGAFVIIANTLGFNIPSGDQFPQSLKDLFGDTGIKGFKFWDIIKIVSILLVTAEFMRYTNTNKALGAKSSPMTIGIFTLLIVALGLTTIPELIKRVKGTDFNLEALR
tara:strand:- start:104 stop:646 length:543 start_codon:yes stop_codon:yes gene_type:complete